MTHTLRARPHARTTHPAADARRTAPTNAPAAPAPDPAPRVAPPIDVVHLSAEWAPLARTGGLGEAVRGLVEGLAEQGAGVAAILPLYRTLREAARDAGWVIEPAIPAFDVALGERTESVRVVRLVSPDVRAGAPTLFAVEHDGAFDRAGLYGEGGGVYPDNPWRFALFAVAALTALPRLAPHATVLHAHDWHAALAPLYLRSRFAEPGAPDADWHAGLAAVLTVHNAGYQGDCDPALLPSLGIPWSLFDWRVLEWYGRVSVLKGGLAFADAVVTVSAAHAEELRTPEGGLGLHGAFKTLGDRLRGIRNGIDERLWDPRTNPALVAPFAADDLAGKRACKRALQRTAGLPERDDVPLVAFCGRLVNQKGLDLLLASRTLWSDPGLQLVVLGEGEAHYADALAARAREAPERIAAWTRFDVAREHALLAGADMVVVPSLYEPCGLVQVHGQRYGAVPVVRRVGGLAESVADGETGLVFDAYDAGAFDEALARALGWWRDRPAWEALTARAMGVHVGWGARLAAYGEVYAAVRRRPVATAMVPEGAADEVIHPAWLGRAAHG
jgi:starch synthase